MAKTGEIKDRCTQYALDVVAGDDLRQFFDLCRVADLDIIFQPMLFTLMVSFQDFQLGYIHIQIHLFPDTVISGAQCFDFCIGQSRFVYIITGSHGGFTGHDL